MEPRSKKKISGERGYHKSTEKLQLRSPPTLTKTNSATLSTKHTSKPKVLSLHLSNPRQLVPGISLTKIQRHGSFKISPNASNSSLRSPVLSKAEPRFPMAPKLALVHFSEEFNKIEQIEVMDYESVFFLGTRDKIKPSLEGNNSGYDDERGDYIITMGDHIAYRYEIIKILGKGSFGQVVECFDYKRQEKIALKIIKNKKRFHQQASVEIKILQQLRENDIEGRYNVVKIKNYFVFRKHICITFDLLSMNLYELLRQNNFEGLSLTLIHRFSVQLLVCLQYISKLKIIHCDLKPENILLKDMEKALINVIDFGSSCLDSEKIYSYIQSRFYRAPEIILGVPYTTAIDMWSLGCILVEFFTGTPLFPGENEHIQFIYIMNVLGVPPISLIDRSSKRDTFFDENLQPKIVANRKGVIKMPGERSLDDILQGTPEPFIDLVKRCLCWQPELRIKPVEGLEHPWISGGIKKKKN